MVETTADCRGLPPLRGAGAGQGAQAVDIRDLPVLRAAGTAGLAEAALALRRPGLRGQDLDRGHRRTSAPRGADVACRCRGTRQVGELALPVAVRGRRARGVLVDGDGRRDRARHPAGRGPRPGGTGPGPRHRRDVVPLGDEGARHASTDRPGRPRRAA